MSAEAQRLPRPNNCYSITQKDGSGNRIDSTAALDGLKGPLGTAAPCLPGM